VSPGASGTDGSFKAPKFDHSPTKWQCVGAGNIIELTGVSIQGTVSASGKLSKVTAQSFANDGGIFFKNTYLLDWELD